MRNRALLPLLIIGGVLLALYYVGARLAAGIGALPSAIVMTILIAGLFAFRPLHAVRIRWVRSAALKVVHLEMAVMSFLLAFTILRDLIFIPISFTRPEISEAAFGPNGTLLLFAAVFTALVAGIVINRLGPRIIRIRIPIPNLPAEFHDFTIAQISDLHVDPLTKPAFVEKVVDKVLALQPQMIALTGDIGDGNLNDSKIAMKPLGRLTKAPHGAFYVTGNHEFYSDGLAWVAAFKQLGLKTLMNTHDTIRIQNRTLLIAGVLDPASQIAIPHGAPNPQVALRGAPPADVKILLAHQPGIASAAAELGFDLQLSGHTHAGQFFPWTLIIGRVHEFANGLGRKGKMWVYVNPGTGSWGPQVRLGTRTEITLLTLVAE